MVCGSAGLHRYRAQRVLALFDAPSGGSTPTVAQSATEADVARDARTRIADTIELLRNEVDAWVSTSGAHGPWLVPLSFAWHDGQLIFATSDDSRTVANLRQDPRVRVALGTTRDVVVIDGLSELSRVASLSQLEVAAFGDPDTDPRTWATATFRVRPDRVQAWREENEIRGRTIMRAGQWLG